MNRDRHYALPRHYVGDFSFDDAVADVFPDMIARSVPGYASILSMIEQLAARYVTPNTNIYDLGCSLGAATWLIRNQAPESCTIHAVDNSAAMVSRLRLKLAEEDSLRAGDRKRCTVAVHEADVREFAMEQASFVVLNLTLQFVAPDERAAVLQTSFDALQAGGALLLSEKIKSTELPVDALLIDLHHDFKRAHGYSELEIAQKRTAIENRLIPESLEQHVERLKHVGFTVVAPWFQCFNFVSILAVKQ
jgi:tRNA (cmo5U34)-methyltransferase